MKLSVVAQSPVNVMTRGPFNVVARRPFNVMARRPFNVVALRPFNVVARLDRAITRNIVLMQMARSSRAMTMGGGHDDGWRP